MVKGGEAALAAYLYCFALYLLSRPEQRLFIVCYAGRGADHDLGLQAQFFEGVSDSAGRSFRQLHFLFVGLLFPSNIPTDLKWMPRARTHDSANPTFRQNLHVLPCYLSAHACCVGT